MSSPFDTVVQRTAINPFFQPETAPSAVAPPDVGAFLQAYFSDPSNRNANVGQMDPNALVAYMLRLPQYANLRPAQINQLFGAPGSAQRMALGMKFRDGAVEYEQQTGMTGTYGQPGATPAPGNPFGPPPAPGAPGSPSNPGLAADSRADGSVRFGAPPSTVVPSGGTGTGPASLGKTTDKTSGLIQNSGPGSTVTPNTPGYTPTMTPPPGTGQGPVYLGPQDPNWVAGQEAAQASRQAAAPNATGAPVPFVAGATNPEYGIEPGAGAFAGSGSPATTDGKTISSGPGATVSNLPPGYTPGMTPPPGVGVGPVDTSQFGPVDQNWQQGQLDAQAARAAAIKAAGTSGIPLNAQGLPITPGAGPGTATTQDKTTQSTTGTTGQAGGPGGVPIGTEPVGPPIVTPAPPGTPQQGVCPPGQVWNEGSNSCVINSNSTCGPGYHRDPDGQCVPDAATPPPGPTGPGSPPPPIASGGPGLAPGASAFGPSNYPLWVYTGASSGDNAVHEMPTGKSTDDNANWSQESSVPSDPPPQPADANNGCGPGQYFDPTAANGKGACAPTSSLCAVGYHWDTTTAGCVKDGQATGCGSGTGKIWDSAQNKCVTAPGTPTPPPPPNGGNCAPDERWNPATKMCEPIQ